MASREIPGSFRSEPAGAQAIRDADPDEKISVTVHLKTTEQPAGPTEARRAFARFATRHRLGVRHDPVRRRIQLDGTSEQLSRAFGTSLRIYDDGIRRFRARSGPLVVPEELETWTIAALGLDERPVVKHRRLTSAAAPADGDGLWPTQIADLYGLGHDLDAPGQCIGIIALGGGYLPADLAAAAKGMNRPLPMVVDCPVNGTTNLFGGGQPSDEEISLDLQVVAALVPSARIAVYFADNNLRGLTDAIRQAVADNVNRPRVLSISWGSAEEFWAQSDRDAVESAFTDAAKLGITVVAAAGDYLATAGLQDDQAHVLFPASSPLALACGGTQITLDSGGAALAGEAVWNDGSIGTGGGISDVFELPAYQNNAAIPPSFNDGKVRRGIPDICAAASHSPGYRIVLNGQPQAMQGTSAAAPLWASLIAAANSRRGAPLGAVHSFLYADRTLCRAVVEGNNRLDGVGYDAGPGWNACTGLGVPNSRTVEGLAAIPDHQTQTVAAGNVS